MPARLAPTGTGSAANTLAAGNDPRFTNGAMQTLSVSTSFTLGTNTTNGLTIPINGAVNTLRQFTFQTAGVRRFELGAAGGAESGGGQGTDFQLVAYADDGVTVAGYVWYAHRFNGSLSIGNVEVQSGTGAFSTLTASTPAAGDSSANVATSAYVSNAVDGIATLNTTGGTTTLAAAQNGTAVVLVSGTLTANAILLVPNTGLLRILNRTSGAFSLTVKTAAGTGIVVTQNTGSILIADGTNVVIADNDFAGLVVPIASGGTGASTAAAARTALGAAPIADPTFTGLFTSSGPTTVFGSNTGGSASFTINAAAGTYRTLHFYTAGSPRWDLSTDNVAEAGSNAGTNFVLNCFSDTGAYVATPMTVTRSTGNVALPLVTITGGTINGTTVGATVPATGAFSTLGVTGHILRSSITGLTATGTTLATALVLTRTINVITAGAASTGVVLPNGGIGTEYIIINRTANTLNIFPPSGSVIDALAASAATTTATLTTKRFVQVSATQYFTA